MRERFANAILQAVGSDNVVVGKQMFQTIIENQNFLMKHTVQLENEDLKRPNVAGFYTNSVSGAKKRVMPLSLWSVFRIATDNDAVRLVIDVLQREIFKNGATVEPNYKYKCKNKECQKEYDTRPVDLEGGGGSSVQKGRKKKGNVQDEDLKCDVCGKSDFEQPTPKGRKILNDLLETSQNDNGQTLKTLAVMFNRDLETFDQGYLFLLYDYEIKGNKITGKTLKEMITVSPVQVSMVGNNDGRLGVLDNGAYAYVCPLHRHKLIQMKSGVDDSPDVEPRCQMCGTIPIRAIVEVNNSNAGGTDGSLLYYGLDEVIVKPGKYMPGLMYGYPVICSIWSKCEALRHMDEYVRKYFDKERPPKSLLVVGTKNINTAMKFWDQLKQKAKEDPYGLHPLMVESERGGRNMVQHIDLTGSLQDLQFIDVRAEFKRAIGAMYGVLPLFSGDLPNGWSQDGLAMAVTNRAVSWGQRELEEGLFAPLAKMLGVNDWHISLRSGESTDEYREEQIQGQRISNAQMMRNMGFEPMLNAEGQFVYSSKPTLEANVGGQGGTGGVKDTTQNGYKEESMTQNSGEPTSPRPSDTGGTGQGSPASGEKTSRSQKSFRKLGKSRYVVE